MKEKVSQPIYRVRVEENLLVPMRDGVKLAGDIIRPDVEDRFPVILEYNPYRKDDLQASTSKPRLTYWARRGYIGFIVDIRGLGASEGSSDRPFREQEWMDGYDIVEWIAEQPWCDGNIAMTGGSYGGLTCWMTAAQNPPHLKTIVPYNMGVGGYDSWCGFPGGNKATQVLYPAMMLAFNFSPPHIDPAGRWLKVWRHHLENNKPWIFSFIENQVDGPIHRAYSIAENYKKIRVPVFMLGGWHDIFPSSVFKHFEGLPKDLPKKAIIGPWMHAMPNVAKPGPRIDIYYEVLRWFDYWLKGKDTGIMDEPPLTIFVCRYNPPSIERDMEAGEWRYEEGYPLEGTREEIYYIHGDGILSKEASPDPGGRDEYDYNPTVGVTGMGLLTAFALPWGLPLDQRSDEALSLTYTTEPLQEDVEVTGFPRAILYISSSADIATFVVKLCDVAPDGRSALVSKGLLNATHRESHEKPAPLEPGRIYELSIELNAVSYIFEKGHRIRLAVSSADFPQIWPTPKPARNTIFYGGNHPSRIILPLISKPRKIPDIPKFRPPSGEMPSYKGGVKLTRWEMTRDLARSMVTVNVEYEEWLDMDEKAHIEIEHGGSFHVSEDEPSDVSAKGYCNMTLRGSAFFNTVRIEAKNMVESTLSDFNAFATIKIEMRGLPYFSKSWSKSIPRTYL